MDYPFLLGDDSPLLNTWDEICVQLQGEESLAWDVFLQTVELFVDVAVDELQNDEREAVWLITPAGEDWVWESVEERDPDPVVDQDVKDFVVNRVLTIGTNWSNHRIRAYLKLSG